MRRSEEREAALDAVLNDFRETCQRIYRDRLALVPSNAYDAARAKARDAIFRVMRRENKPQQPGKP